MQMQKWLTFITYTVQKQKEMLSDLIKHRQQHTWEPFICIWHSTIYYQKLLLFIFPNSCNICNMTSSPSNRFNDLPFYCACEYTNQIITFCWPQHLHLKSQSRWPLHPLDAVCPCSSLALTAQVVRGFPEIPLRLDSVGHRSKAGASWGASRSVEGIWRPL